MQGCPVTEGWGIAQAASAIGLTAHTLRYYERIGLAAEPPRGLEGPDTLSERNELLKSHRDAVRQRIAELQADLVVIDAKIERYSVMEQDSVTIRQE
jgi:DNA-binding transcriptional MerR regulator